MTLDAHPKVYPDNYSMAIAWRDCITWAATEPKVAAHFFISTGKRTPFEISIGIDAMIDKSSGVTSASIDEFVDWFNHNIWGQDPFTGEVYGDLEEDD